LSEFKSSGSGWKLAACLAASLFLAGAARAQSPYRNEIVAMRVTRQSFDEDRPWAKTNPEVRDATAVVVSRGLLLAEASMVQNATFIQVEKQGRADWTPARLVHEDSAINLALVTVDEPNFFDDLTPVDIASNVATEGVVHSVRWNDRQLEVSNSRPGRVEVVKSPFGSVYHAVLRLSTDFSGGGWSEPVFAGGKLIGITVSQDGQTATVIPAEILKAYVESPARDGGGPDYLGFASMGELRWQTNTDRALAAHFGLEGEPRGVFIRQVPWGSTGCSSLMPHDILLELDGHAIDASGNYNHPLYGQLRFEHIAVDGHVPGDIVPALVWRDRRFVELQIELRSHPPSADLIPWRRGGSAPPYLVAGGFVFRELDGRYLSIWGKDWRSKAPSQLSYFYDLRGNAQSPERRRIIIVSKVLPAAYNIGYHGLADIPVKSINGLEIDSIADVEQAFAQPVDDLHRITFYSNVTIDQVLLDRAGFEDATRAILNAYDIPHPLRLPESDIPDLGPRCSEGS